MSDEQVAKFRTVLLAVLVAGALVWVWFVYSDSSEGTLHDEQGVIDEDSVELMEELSPIGEDVDGGN